MSESQYNIAICNMYIANGNVYAIFNPSPPDKFPESHTSAVMIPLNVQPAPSHEKKSVNLGMST